MKDIYGENYMIEGKVARTDEQLKEEVNIEAKNFYDDIFGITKS